MPEVTPPAVIRLPSCTTRFSIGIAPKWARKSWAFQCVVARLPFSNPAAPSTSDPVQTEVMYCAFDARSRMKSSRSEEHTSELQSLMRISYAVFCLKKKQYTSNKPHLTPDKKEKVQHT